MHIVTAHWNEDIDWLQEFCHEHDVSYSVCDKVTNPNYKGTGDCDVELNRGRETSAYLKYIINHYDNLPEKVAFIHGHHDSHHQLEGMVSTLQKVIDKDIKDYMSLNGQPGSSFLKKDWIFDYANGKNGLLCDKEKQEQHGLQWFSGSHLQKKRSTSCFVGHDCCAQFVVPKERILQNSKEFYQDLFDHTMIEEKAPWGLEYTWHIIFGRPAYDENYQTIHGSDASAVRRSYASTDASTDAAVRRSYASTRLCVILLICAIPVGFDIVSSVHSACRRRASR